MVKSTAVSALINKIPLFSKYKLIEDCRYTGLPWQRVAMWQI